VHFAFEGTRELMVKGGGLCVDGHLKGWGRRIGFKLGQAVGHSPE
jgi:hypothetical protein